VGEAGDERLGVEAPDALRLHQGHEQSTLAQQRPHHAEQCQRDRLPFQIPAEQQPLGEEAIDQVEPHPPFGNTGGCAEDGLFEQMDGYLPANLGVESLAGRSGRAACGCDTRVM
jgi:hypothetical protein